MEVYLETAKRMMDTDDLPLDLIRRLREIDRLCRICGGALGSRQLIAAVIVDMVGE